MEGLREGLIVLDSTIYASIDEETNPLLMLVEDLPQLASADVAKPAFWRRGSTRVR